MVVKCLSLLLLQTKMFTYILVLRASISNISGLHRNFMFLKLLQHNIPKECEPKIMKCLSSFGNLNRIPNNFSTHPISHNLIRSIIPPPFAQVVTPFNTERQIHFSPPYFGSTVKIVSFTFFLDHVDM